MTSPCYLLLMGCFHWDTCTIDMAGGEIRACAAEVGAIPAIDAVTMSFAHEYVHFLQLVSSVAGIRMFAEMIDYAVGGALCLGGIISAAGGEVDERQDILSLLRAQPDHAGANNPDLGPRGQSILADCGVLFSTNDYPVSGHPTPWSVVRESIQYNGKSQDFVGFVTPRNRFRPFVPSILAEGMARRVDQWLRRNHGYAFQWDDSHHETEVYDGVRNVLSQHRYEHNVAPGKLDELTVVVCHMALATNVPDQAMELMLARLADSRTAGGLIRTVVAELRDVLTSARLLDSGHFNRAIKAVMKADTSKAVAWKQLFGVFDQLERVHAAASTALSRPLTFADPSVTWPNVVAWMGGYGLPHVQALDGPVANVSGVLATEAATELLTEARRVMF